MTASRRSKISQLHCDFDVEWTVEDSEIAGLMNHAETFAQMIAGDMNDAVLMLEHSDKLGRALGE